MKYIPQGICGIIGGLISFLYGDISYALLVLVSLSVLDFITGILGAIEARELDSNICFRGILKKIYIFVLVALGHMLDVAISSNVIQSTIIFFYIANEGISIIENSAKSGLPIPQQIIDVLKQLKNDNKEV